MMTFIFVLAPFGLPHCPFSDFFTRKEKKKILKEKKLIELSRIVVRKDLNISVC